MADRLYRDPVQEALDLIRLRDFSAANPPPTEAEIAAQRERDTMASIYDNVGPILQYPVNAVRLGVPALAGGAYEALKSGVMYPGQVLYGELPPPDITMQTNPEATIGKLMDAASVPSAGMLPRVAGRMDPNTLSIFAGREAKTADMAALAKARDMERIGTAPDQIWRETGWGKGADGEWRFEIDDSNMKLRQNPDGSYNIDHQKFEDAYPGLLAAMKQDIRLQPATSSMQGYWEDASKTLQARGTTIEDLREVALHELEHAVQSVERFAAGTSPSSNDVARRRQMIPTSEITAARNAAQADLSRIDDQIKQHYNGTRTIYEPEWGKLDRSSQIRITNELLKGPLKDQRKDYVRAFDIMNNGPTSPYSTTGLYRREAGEAEARNATYRADYPEDLRRLWSPFQTQDVPTDQQWVAPRRSKLAWNEDGTPNPLGEALAVANMRYHPQTDTYIDPSKLGNENFNTWFGDSVVRRPYVSSRDKVVREPLVVYHGTDKDFNVFDPNIEGTVSTSLGSYKTERPVMFFAEDPRFASDFAVASSTGRPAQGANVMPVHLSIKNPIWLDESGLDNDTIRRLTEQGINDRWLGQFGNPRINWEMFDGPDGVDFVNAAKKAGYDGAFIKELDPVSGESKKVWVAFEPTQVKSATGNAGTYDPTNPDIRASERVVDPWEEAVRIASQTYRIGDELAPAGSGYTAVPGKPSTVDIPGVGKVEARPIQPLTDTADAYMRSVGRPGEHDIRAFPAFDEDRARRIAEQFALMKHDPSDPRVRRAYDAMIDETLAQYRSLKDAGIDFRFMKDGDADPYAASPALGYADIIKNGRLTVFPTDFGFGTSAAFDPATNPLLKGVGKIGDKPNAVANDAFRVVHDAYGHFAPGNPFFRHQGEERAWAAHSRMYSPDALPAMTSETRGQNSWLNFGPHGEANRKALGADTVFADQKTGIMDPWTWTEGKFAEGGGVPVRPGALTAEEEALAVARKPVAARAVSRAAAAETMPAARAAALDELTPRPLAPVEEALSLAAKPVRAAAAARITEEPPTMPAPVRLAEAPVPQPMPEMALPPRLPAKAERPVLPKEVSEPPVPDAAPITAPRMADLTDEHRLGTERGERKVIKSAKLTDAEKSMLAEFAPAERKAAADRILSYRAANPVSAGSEPIEVKKVSFEKGNPVIDWQKIAYGYHIPPGETRAPKPGTPVYEKHADKIANEAFKAVVDVVNRANSGDEAALKILRQVGWYRETMAKGFNERGGAYPAFSDALGATSPNTSVDQNYRYSVEGQREFARGTHDDKVRFMRDWTGPLDKVPPKQLLRRPGVIDKVTGEEKQYGMNSRNLAMAFADRWRALFPLQKPKARNFSGNLGGATDEGTIDVWAARFLRRMAGLKRIPVAAESNVGGDLGVDLKPKGEFGFGQEIFRRLSKKLNKSGHLAPFLKELGYRTVTPMDLQALTWFIEKEHWTRNNWTTAAGEGGSFEDEIRKFPTERWQAGHSVTQKAAPPDELMAAERKRVEDVLRDDPNIRVYRVHPTFGAYGGKSERSFDTELSTTPNWDPNAWMRTIVEQARDHKQEDVFFSRRIPDHEVAMHPNARPGVEVYFQDRKTIEDIKPVLEQFVGNDLDGFTYITDLRIRERDAGGKSVPDYVGVRLQWVPEIVQRNNKEAAAQWVSDPAALESAKDAAVEKMRRVLDEIDRQGHSIVDARIHHYDTLVLGMEDYDGFLESGAAGAGIGQGGGRGWLGQPLGDHLARRDRALAAGNRGAGDVDPGGTLVEPEPVKRAMGGRVDVTDYLAQRAMAARRGYGGRVSTPRAFSMPQLPDVRSGLDRDPLTAALAVSKR